MWDLPGPGLEPVSPALAGGVYSHCATREAPYLFYDWNFVHFDSFTQFVHACPPLTGPPSSLATTSLFSVSVSLLFCFFKLIN